MQLRNTIAAFLVTVLSGAALCAAPERTDVEQQAAAQGCSSDLTNMSICAAYDYKVLNAELNLLYNQQIAQLETPADEKRMLTAQRTWLKYVQADCSYRTGPRANAGPD